MAKLSEDAQALYDALKGREGVRWKDVKGVLPNADLGRQVQAWNELLHAGLAEGLIHHGGVGAVFTVPAGK